MVTIRKPSSELKKHKEPISLIEIGDVFFQNLRNTVLYELGIISIIQVPCNLRSPMWPEMVKNEPYTYLKPEKVLSIIHFTTLIITRILLYKRKVVLLHCYTCHQTSPWLTRVQHTHRRVNTGRCSSTSLA